MTIKFAAARTALAAGILVLAGIGVAHAQAGAVAWKAGTIYVPASLTTNNANCQSELAGKCDALIKPGEYPVILFLHGCGGPRSPRTFFGLGTIVVAPNSFAGGASCKADAGSKSKLIADRQADVAYAANQLKAAAWADPAKLILAGYSNGAQTSATYPGDEFKARVIVAWTCNNPRAPEQNGVRGKGAVLAVLGANDELYRKAGISGDCGAALARREGSRSVLIKGGPHEILDHPATKAAVSEFVPAVLK